MTQIHASEFNFKNSSKPIRISSTNPFFHTIGKEIKKKVGERKKRLKGIRGIPSRFSKTQLPLVLELARDSGRSPVGDDPPSKLASTLLRITRHMSPLSPRRIPDDFSRLSRDSWSVHREGSLSSVQFSERLPAKNRLQGERDVEWISRGHGAAALSIRGEVPCQARPVPERR